MNEQEAKTMMGAIKPAARGFVDGVICQLGDKSTHIAGGLWAGTAAIACKRGNELKSAAIAYGCRVGIACAMNGLRIAGNVWNNCRCHEYQFMVEPKNEK